MRPREGQAILGEGKALKEGDPRDGSGMEQGRRVRVCQETAERLRKPESGTGPGVDNPAQMGLARGTSSKGPETSGSRNAGTRPAGEEEANTLKGTRSRGE